MLTLTWSVRADRPRPAGRSPLACNIRTRSAVWARRAARTRPPRSLQTPPPSERRAPARPAGTQRGTPLIFSGTGTGGWESALTNTLSPGDKVLTFRYGQFSHLWVDMMTRLGLEVEVYDRPWGEGADEKTVEEVLRKDTAHKIKAVCVVHNETTTGVTSDIGGVRAAMDAAKHPALLLVDGVSSIGALEFKFDDWGVDVAVTGSQKALSLPTGLALMCISEKVRGARVGALARGVERASSGGRRSRRRFGTGSRPRRRGLGPCCPRGHTLGGGGLKRAPAPPALRRGRRSRRTRPPSCRACTTHGRTSSRPTPGAQQCCARV